MLEATRTHGEMSLREEPDEMISNWPFYPAYDTVLKDGDVYTREHDRTLWAWHAEQWYGPFDDLDTAIMAARMLR